MSNRSKLEKFADNLKFTNVFENTSFENPQLVAGYNQPVNFKGNWGSAFFKNENPIVLELACGRGEYSIGLAQHYPLKNFIGIDIKGARIWKGASQAISHQLSNVAFVRTRIELIDHFFATGEVDEIWITFPDPFPRPSKSNKRLVSAFFLNIYKKIIKPNGILHLKTDDDALYQFGLKSITDTDGFQIEFSSDNLYASTFSDTSLDIKTYYEKMHLELGKTIKYIRFSHK